MATIAGSLLPHPLSSSSFHGAPSLLRRRSSFPSVMEECSRPLKWTAPPSRRPLQTVSSFLSDLAKELLQQSPSGVPRPQADPKTVVSIILGGEEGTHLFPLTKRRAKPAIPIGGAYRLIDVPVSNCINSGLDKIYVLTQFNSASLNRYLAQTYNFGNGINFGDGFVEVLAAMQKPGEDGMNWFQGTADAVRQFKWIFEDSKIKELEHVLILSGDHLCRMDYMDLIKRHQETGADITISSIPMDKSRASDFGLMKINASGRVIQFIEKPKGAVVEEMKVDSMVPGLSSEEAMKKPYLASMGIYVFRKDVLVKLLRWQYPSANDFGSEIIPAAAKEYNVQACIFNDYWEDIGTIKSFYDANLALTAQARELGIYDLILSNMQDYKSMKPKNPKFCFYDAHKPIFTSPRNLPPTKIEQCHDCSAGACERNWSSYSLIHTKIRNRLSTSQLERLVYCRANLRLVRKVKAMDNPNQDTMMMGADYYETEEERGALLSEGKVPVGIGENTKIRGCIIDKNARIGNNVLISNSDNVQEAERASEGFYIRTGIVVILKNSTIRDGMLI